MVNMVNIANTENKLTWNDTQLKRLKELGFTPDREEPGFDSPAERNKAFQKLEKTLVKQNRFRLEEFRTVRRRPALCRLETGLVEALTDAGFVQVTTPTIMSRKHLAKMTIDENHPLYSQVFWLDKDKCLRPMLAPHLYYLLKDLLRLWEKPVRIFEVGSCFRKETKGARHSPEFTMLNLVEMGLPLEHREQRLNELAALVMETTGIENYRLLSEDSTVYGETIDIEASNDTMENIELGSAAFGPHPLDRPWRITEPWVGIGFGLERLLMVRDNSPNLSAMTRSLSYQNGIRLSL